MSASPVIDADSRPFWEAARQRRLALPFARASGRPHFFPRSVDPDTGSDDIEWREVSGSGMVYSYTVARRAPDPAFDGAVPYVVALIELDEGVRMLSTITTDDVASVHIGQRVHVVFDPMTDDVTIPRFRVVEEDAS